MTIKIEVYESVKKEDLIVETPFYYKHRHLSDYFESFTYGKITDKQVITIHKIDYFLDKTVSFEIEKESKPNFKEYACYISEKKSESSQEEFSKIALEMKTFLEQETKE